MPPHCTRTSHNNTLSAFQKTSLHRYTSDAALHTWACRCGAFLRAANVPKHGPDFVCFLSARDDRVPVQTAHMIMYYFLITTLIIYPTAVIAAVFGIVGGTRFRRQRRKIGSFDAAQVWYRGASRAGFGAQIHARAVRLWLQLSSRSALSAGYGQG